MIEIILTFVFSVLLWEIGKRIYAKSSLKTKVDKLLKKK